MTRRAALAALLVAAASFELFPAALEASVRARIFRFKAAGKGVRAVVPRVFEPLLPGSFYPNRRKQAAWTRGPAVIVEGALARRAEGRLLARGLAVARVESVDAATVDAIAEELSRRIDGGVGAVTLLARRPADALSSRALRAAALFDPGARPAALPSLPCVEVAIFHRAARGDVPPAPPPAEGGCVSEKWYRSDGDFPDEAFRDAAEWLASASRPRD